MHITPRFTSWQLKDARVILRADLNVPLKNGTIIDDFRLTTLLPTLDYLLEHGAHVKIITHIGRPKNAKPELSTQHLVPWFVDHGYDIAFAPTIIDLQKNQSRVVLGENLRFFSGETNSDPAFASDLAQGADYYINDAFGALHRTDTSVTLLANEFEQASRSIGYLVEKELIAFSRLQQNIQHPFVMIWGGKKFKTKSPLVKEMLRSIDTLYLCPAICFTFLHARAKPIGASYVELESTQEAELFLEEAKKFKTKIHFPVDYLVRRQQSTTLTEKNASDLDQHDVGISCGPQTEKMIGDEIMNARTVFFNGVSGFVDQPETLNKSIFQALEKSAAFTVIAGADTVAAARKLGLDKGVNHLSTGGGAALALLAGKALPALQMLKS